jgi:undecaprenyl-diphosphatase
MKQTGRILSRFDLILYLSLTLFLVFGFFYDLKIAHFFNFEHNSFFDGVMLFLSNTYFLIALLLIVASILYFKNKKKEAVLIIISTAVTFLLSFLIKLLVARARPDQAVILLSDFSFPSIHAACIFSSVAIMLKFFSKLKFFWLGFAVLVSFSRIYLGVHYLTDVAFGAILGYSIALLILKYSKMENKKWKNQN